MQDDYEIRALNPRLDASALIAKDENRSLGGLCMDESAFRIFYEQSSRPLFRYLMAATRAQDLAEDLLQEAYCRFLTAHLPDMAEAQARSYLFRIATNILRDRWRRSREDSQADNLVELASSVPHLERKIALRQGFDRLKPRERQLLWLAYVEGSNHEEIAECTGLRRGSIRLLLYRARHKLAALIMKDSSGAKTKAST